MNKEFKRMQELAGLNEIKINQPTPVFKTNDQFVKYLEKNSKFREELINTIFNSPNFNKSGDPSWEDVRQGWINNPIERFTDFNEEDELMIDDNNDNRIYISINPMSSDSTAFASFEVELPPNKFYCEYF